METVATCLAILSVLQAFIIAVMSATVPWTVHRMFKAEAKVEEMDSVIVELMELAGIRRGGVEKLEKSSGGMR